MAVENQLIFKCNNENYSKRNNCKWYFAGICRLRKIEKDDTICRFEKKGGEEE